MFRNYLITALRNLLRNRLYTALNIVGLAVGLAAALLIAVYVRDEVSHDRWIPGHERIFRVSNVLTNVGAAAYAEDVTLGYVALWLKNDFSEVEATTRLTPWTDAPQVSLRRDTHEINLRHYYWGDTNVFDVLALPVVVGDLRSALEKPEGIVLTRSTARRLFGRDDPIGETLEVDRKISMVVTAVLEDLPSNTHLVIEAIASGLNPASPMVRSDAVVDPTTAGWAYTYMRLAPGVSPDRLQQVMPNLVDKYLPPGPFLAKLGKKSSDRVHLVIQPISNIHLSPTGEEAMKPGSSRSALYATVAIGILIVCVAVINFVNLTTARASRRVTEIGVRKVSGALKWNLIAQFIGESVLLVALSSALAILLAATVLPFFGAYLQRDFAIGLDPALAVAGLLIGICTGIIAGVYPAFVLSAFRPAVVLKKAAYGGGSYTLRQALVVLQFTVLIGLMVAATIIQKQMSFIVADALRFNKETVLLIDTEACPTVLRDQIAGLPGVVEASCSAMLLEDRNLGITVTSHDGTPLGMQVALTDSRFMSLYGFSPIAGRFFDSGRGEDTASAASISRGRGTTVLNETAVRRLGYPSPEAALGQRPFGADGPEVIGVAADFSMKSLRSEVKPTAFLGGARGRANFDTLNVKLSGSAIPQTLAQIDQVWRALGDRPGPISQRFYDQYVQALYTDVVRQAGVFALCSSLTLVLAILGLFGLSAFAAEERTREIGVRKAMGARTRDVLRLLIWQFTKPVLWANVIAWPAAYFAMRRWLDGFAYHIDVSPWIFLAVSAGAIAIAIVTVSGHALVVARAQPVTALRYE